MVECRRQHCHHTQKTSSVLCFRLKNSREKVYPALLYNGLRSGSSEEGEKTLVDPRRGAVHRPAYRADSETSTVELRDKVQAQFGKGVSLSTISRARDRLGWTRSRVLYGQLIRNVNKAARLAFALRMVEQGENYDDVIFTDESTFWVENHSGYYYRRRGTRKVKVGKPNIQQRSTFGPEFRDMEPPNF